MVSESLPHLKRGAIRDFFRILHRSQQNNPLYNRSDNVYQFPHATLEFFGADDDAKVRGPRRDVLFINEANNVPWETARGLDIRTNLFTFCDWNPVEEFWAHEHWLGKPANAYIHSTYQDARDVLPPEVVANIESNRDDPNWWHVYGEGKVGKVEGLVYPHFSIIDELPEDGDRFYGLDFGFTTDPSVLVECVLHGADLCCRELIYECGLTNQQIAARMEWIPLSKTRAEIFADAAEPKSIEEIYQTGFNIKPAPKGQGSVEYGHQKINQHTLYWTTDSVNCIKEQRNFRYIMDKNGRLTQATTHFFSHGMDARRYGLTGRFAPVSGIMVG